MATTPYRLRVDEEAIGAGTTVRFALLVILLLMSSASMILDVITGLSGANDEDGFGCALAAGADPVHSSAIDTMAHTQAQRAAFDACVARYEAPPPWWVTLGWPILVLAVAVALFWGLPAWKRRRGRVVLLPENAHDGAISGELAKLADELGRLVATVARLDRKPRFVVDPAADSMGAVVFGSNRRPTICLPGGLLVRRIKDPKGFQAVVLHELAHVRNGDVTITYLTVAIWRVFVILVLLPYVGWIVSEFVTGPGAVDWPVTEPDVIRSMLLTALMVVLVYLARADVLRSREIYADLAAVAWGADQHGWAVPMSRADGVLRRALVSFVGLWRTHPRWELRRASFTDPASLFGVQSLPMFLTGAAAMLVDIQANNYVGRYPWPGVTWFNGIIAVGAAGLVTGVAGVALWRAATHSVLTGRQAPSGVRAGLWLGAGMATAVLITNDAAIYQWLPSQPEVLLFVICAGATFAWWMTQSAHLWLRAWPGRTIRLAILLGLAAGCLVLSAWFQWWEGWGSGYANGVSKLLLTRAGGDQILALLGSLGAMAGPQLVHAAVAALWIVPLLVWALGPAMAIPRWVHQIQRRTGDMVAPVGAVPPLYRTLVAALLGGVSGWFALIAVMAVLHTTQPPPSTLSANEQATEVYIAGLLVAWVAGMTVAAVIASVVTSHYRLLAALIASQAAGVIAFVGMFPLAAFDGCVLPLATLRGSCAWRPGMSWQLFSYLTGPVVAVAAVAAVAAAAVVSAVQGMRGSGTWSAPRVLARPARPGGRIARRVGTAVLCATSLGLVAAGGMSQGSNGASATAAAPSLSAVVANTPVSAQTRAFQLGAWYGHGGSGLMERFITTSGDFVALLEQGKGTVDDSSVHRLCADFDQIAADADAYFHVPDPQAQSLWQTLITEVRTVGQDCDNSVAQSDGDLLVRTDNELVPAAVTANAVQTRILAAMRAGGGGG